MLKCYSCHVEVIIFHFFYKKQKFAPVRTAFSITPFFSLFFRTNCISCYCILLMYSWIIPYQTRVYTLVRKRNLSNSPFMPESDLQTCLCCELRLLNTEIPLTNQPSPLVLEEWLKLSLALCFRWERGSGALQQPCLSLLVPAVVGAEQLLTIHHCR